MAQNVNGRRSAIDGRTTRYAGYRASLRIRKQIEEAFGWIKTIDGQDKTRFRAVTASDGPSPSPPRLMIWCGCRN